MNDSKHVDKFFKLKMRHWTNGGTGITNFSKNEIEDYKKALEISKREDLVVCSVGFPTPCSKGISHAQCSLHGIDNSDTSSFFDALDRIKKTTS